VAYLRLVSPGVVTDGVTVTLFTSKSDDLVVMVKGDDLLLVFILHRHHSHPLHLSIWLFGLSSVLVNSAAKKLHFYSGVIPLDGVTRGSLTPLVMPLQFFMYLYITFAFLVLVHDL